MVTSLDFGRRFLCQREGAALFAVQSLPQGPAELIRAGGGFFAAGDAAELGNHLFSRQAFHKAGNSFQISGTAAAEAHLRYPVVGCEFKTEAGRAYAHKGKDGHGKILV